MRLNQFSRTLVIFVLLFSGFTQAAGTHGAHAPSQKPASTFTPKPIEIKGLYLGMPESEAEQKIDVAPPDKFTIAGVPSKYENTNARLDFHESKLDEFMFFFDSGSFDDVLRAVKSKYPALQCAGSTVSNAMGASFKQVNCILQDHIGTLTLDRFVSDISTSVLCLTSHRKDREREQENNEKQKDL